MEKFNLYKDIQIRTGGEIYLGVVGPVRTGKSTFVRKFAEQLVLPNLDDAEKARTTDALPASASGRTITTVEPKFIPREAASLTLGDGTKLKIRLVDSVGYLVPGAEGTDENGKARMVKTPWQKEPVPFREAARLGTRKVIEEHSTIGIVLTTDGSFGELPRENFLDAEKEAILGLQHIGKPFVVIVNSSKPYSEEARDTVSYIQNTYRVACLPVNCEQLDQGQLEQILEHALMEFPLTKVVFQIPGWTETLERSHWLKQELFQAARNAMESLHTVRSIYGGVFQPDSPYIRKTKLEQMDLSSGVASVTIELQDALYYQILSEMTGTTIQSEYQLISLVKEMAGLKSSYQKVASALERVRSGGYAVISPEKEEIQMEQPVLMKQGSRYGVKVHATAPSIHLISADLETEVAPLVGSESQAQDLIRYIEESREKQDGADRALIFGKSVSQLVEEGMEAKLVSMSEENQRRLQDIIQRLMNGSAQRLICIML